MRELAVRWHRRHGARTGTGTGTGSAAIPFLRAWRGKVLSQLALGLLLACLALGATILLLGLSGWFIATSALVSLLGITTFSYLVPSAGIRAAALLRVGARYSERVVTHRATFAWLAHLRTVLFTSAVALPPAAVARFRSADLMDRAMSDVDALDQVILRVIAPTVSTALIAAGCMLFFAMQSMSIALVVGVLMVVSGVGLPLVASRLGRGPGIREAATRTQLRTEMIEALEGSREIAIYDEDMVTSARLLRLLETADAERARSRRVTALSTGLSAAVSGAALLVVLGLGLLAFAGRIRAGAPTVAMLVLITVGIFENIEVLPLAYQQAGVVKRAAQRLNHLFRAPTAAAGPVVRDAAFPAHAEVALRDVAFTYRSAGDERDAGEDQRSVVEHVHLTVEPGTLVALVGRSGAGKTTVLKLLAGELEPTAGTITLGGEAIDSISRTEFWRHVGYVAQDSHIFSGSLRDNLLLADPDADDAALFDALHAVGLADVVGSMDDGLDTPIGEAGDRLSGGQRRRLCVARALLRNPAILLLDEPTAGVDAATARHMLAAIRARLPHSSIVVATHDPLPAAMADVVVTVGTAG